MARLRRTNGTYRRTTLADMGHQSCTACGRFYPMPEPKRDAHGFISPQRKTSPCPHCGHDPDQSS